MGLFKTKGDVSNKPSKKELKELKKLEKKGKKAGNVPLHHSLKISTITTNFNKLVDIQTTTFLKRMI